MKNTLTYSYFSSLTPKETILFGKYLRSPYFNEGKRLIKLYDELIKIYDNDAKDSEDVCKEEVYEKVYNSSKFKRTTFNQLCSEMTKHLEKFITLREAESDKMGFYIKLITWLYKCGKLPEFTNVLNKIEKIHKRDIDNIAEYYELKTKIELIKHDSINDTIQTGAPERYKKLHEYSDLFVIERKLYIGSCCLLQEYLKPYNEPLDLELIKFIVERVLKNSSDFRQNNVFIYVLALYTNALLTKSEYDIEMTVSELNELHNHLTNSELNFVFISLLVFFDQLARSDFRYNILAFDMISQMESNGLFNLHSRIGRGKFVPCCLIAIKTGNHDWCFEFLQKYKHTLPRQLRHQTENFVTGLYHFEKKNFDLSLHYLNSIRKADFYIYRRTKFATLFASFEIQDFVSVYNLIDTLKHHFKNSNVPDKDEYLLLFKFFLRYLKHYEQKEDPDKLVWLKKEIMETGFPNLKNYKEWLLEKINGLEKSLHISNKRISNHRAHRQSLKV